MCTNLLNRLYPIFLIVYDISSNSSLINPFDISIFLYIHNIPNSSYENDSLSY
jgi:hypothetical protein